MTNTFVSRLSNALPLGFEVVLFLLINTPCHSKEKVVLRGIEDPFPPDCEMLSEQEEKTANALCESARNLEIRAEALAALQEFIVTNRRKSYAWWRWKMIAVANKEFQKDGLYLELLRIRALEQKINRAENSKLESVITFYSLMDGTRVLHGPCILSDEGFFFSVGEFGHGLRHGRWVHWEGYDKNREVYADGYWRNGKPWEGTLLLLIRGDRTREEFKDGKRKTKAGYEAFDYTPQVFVLPPNRNPDQESKQKKKSKEKSKEDADPVGSKNSSDP